MLIVMCDICKKQVDELSWFEDFRTCEYMVIAKCHGQEDRCRLPREIIHANQIDIGYAFKTMVFEKPQELLESK